MFKNFRNNLAEKATAAKQVVDEKSQTMAESFVEHNLPTVRDACDQAVAKLGVEGVSVSEDTRSLLAMAVTDDEKFEMILKTAYDVLPNKPMPRWLFVKTCKRKREKILAIIGPKDPPAAPAIE